MIKSFYPRSIAIFAAFAFATTLTQMALADGLPPDEQALFDKQISNVVEIQPTRVNESSFLKVFSAPFYKVKILIKQGDGGSSTQDLVVARIDNQLVSVDRPGTDEDLPTFPKTLNPDFKLKTDDDAKALQDALDRIYPFVMDSDKKLEAIKHNGNQWTFVRGNFMNGKVLGFIFEVDAAGAIKSVKFSLQIPA